MYTIGQHHIYTHTILPSRHQTLILNPGVGYDRPWSDKDAVGVVVLQNGGRNLLRLVAGTLPAAFSCDQNLALTWGLEVTLEVCLAISLDGGDATNYQEWSGVLVVPNGICRASIKNT